MKLNIKTKLIGGFLVVVALLIGVLGVGFSALNSVSNESKNIYQNSNENYLWQQWKAFTESETAYYMTYLAKQESTYLESAREQVANAQNVQAELAKVVPPERKQAFESIVAQSPEVSRLAMAALNALAECDPEEYASNLAAWEQNDNKIIAGIDAAIADGCFR
jgi:CHASE3 domain sensor protein